MNYLDEKERDEILKNVEEADAEPKIEEWFNEIVIEDKADCLLVAESARIDMLQCFNIGVTPKALLLSYAITYENLIKSLVSKRGDADSFVIDIANMVKIGYNNVDDQDGRFEVSGNFNVFIQDTGVLPAFPTERTPDSVEACTHWNSDYMKQHIKLLNEISANTIKELSNYNLVIGFPELVFPMFAKVHQTLIVYVSKMRESKGISDYAVNFCNCFEIHAQLMEDKTVAIMYKPNISEKLTVKSNQIATAPTE